MLHVRWPLLVFLIRGAALAEGHELAFRVQEIETSLGVGYAVRLADLNEDGRPDIVVADQQRVLWYENPGWQRHTLLEGHTRPDNVCIAPYDIDGDGHLDLALAADWRPFDTQAGGTIQWLSRGESADSPWRVHPIGEEPTVHRLAWADLDGDGRSELVVVPLMGRSSTPPHFAESPVRILAYQIPDDPAAGPWTSEVINQELHVAHNFCSTDLNRDGRNDLLVASFEGVSLLERSLPGGWNRSLLGAGNQETSPNRGSSEVRNGRLAGGSDYLATIEPWHGFQVVVYTPPDAWNDSSRTLTPPLWQRRVLDDQLKWGHAVACANLDQDADEELIIGVRDNLDDRSLSGVRIYDPASEAENGWNRLLVDPGGVAVEDLVAGDLDGNGHVDIVAAGRATHNVRIYWNVSR